MATLINNKEGLIGDFLGTVPVMQEIALRHDGANVIIHPEAEGLFALIPEDYKLNRVYEDKGEYENSYKIDSSIAFGIGCQAGLYMSQAHFKYFGFPVPKEAPKAHLKYIYNSHGSNHVCDFLVSPFARSLPEDQKWSKENWLTLFSLFPTKKFGILGNSKYDDPDYFIDTRDAVYPEGAYSKPGNIINIYNAPFDTLCGIFKSTGTLISVVTGTSHLAFHLGVKNILLSSQQMSWGNNPDAIRINKNVQDITVKEVVDKLWENSKSFQTLMTS